MKRYFATALTALVLALTACDSGGTPKLGAVSAPASTSATAGTAYSQTLTETGGKAPYTWSVTSGTSLPAGLTLNATTGVLSGTPTTPGTYTISITVTDSSSPAKTSTVTFTLTVAAPPLTVSTTTLPNGTVGAAYSQTLTATGGTPPYTFAVTSGSLPPGLMLDSATGILSGTPSAAGTTSFSVTITDSLGLTATEALTFTASPAPARTGSALLQGQYFFKFSRFFDQSSSLYSFISRQALIGSLTFDGMGNVTAGIMDYADDNLYSYTATVSGTYTINPDGRGVITLSDSTSATFTAAIAVGVVQASGGVATRARLVQTDDLTFTSGFLQLQDPTAFTNASLGGTSVFGWSGDTEMFDSSLTQAGGLYLVGQLVVDNSLTMTGSADIITNQVADAGVALAGSVTPDTTAVGSGTDFAAYGRATLNLTTTTYPDGLLPAQSILYVIDANTSYVISNPASNDDPLYTGYVRKQAGSFTQASLSGAAIAYGSGQSGAAQATYHDTGTTLLYGQSEAQLLRFGFDGVGITTLAADFNLAGMVQSETSASSVPYSVASSGRVLMGPFVGWLSSQNTGFFMTNFGPGPILYTVEPQATATYSNASLNGTFLVGTADQASTFSPLYSGELQADGAGNLTGTLDFFTDNGLQQFGSTALADTSTYSVDSTGRVTVTTNYSLNGSLVSTQNEVFYMTSPNKAVGIEVTPSAATTAPSIIVLEQSAPK